MPDGVVVNASTAPPANNGPVSIGTLVLAAPTAGEFTSLRRVTTTDDFEGVWGERSVSGNAPTWDALDAFFSEGGRQAVLAPYAADYGDALAMLDEELLANAVGGGSPPVGQLAVIGTAPSATLFTDMKTAAAAANLVVLRDVAEGDAVTAMETDAGHAPANDDLGATFAPWCVIPGPRGVIGASARQVPASVVIAALCARIDGMGNVNRAAGGRDFPLKYVTDFAATFTSAQRAALLAAGVNLFKNVDGVLENYTFQTNVAPGPANPYWQFNVARLRMYAVARSRQIGEAYYLKPIDGLGHTAGALQKDITAMFKTELYDNDALYGATPQDAFNVTVSETITDVAQGALKATARFVPTSAATEVEVDLVTVPVGNPVS